jgi:hypothetical protein
LALSTKVFASIFPVDGLSAGNVINTIISRTTQTDEGRLVSEYLSSGFILYGGRNLKKISLSKTTRKVALIIAGQHRTDDSSFSALSDFFNRDDLVVDVFLSSWKNRAPFNIRPEQLVRILENSALDWLRSNEVSLDEKLAENLRSHFDGKSDAIDPESLKSAFSWANSVKLNLDDETEKKFIFMSNPEKMYYHNSFWFRSSPKSVFSEYDLVLKIRPDVEFIKIDIDEIFDDLDCSSFITEDSDGWIMRNWGFGVGDQVVIGGGEAMSNLMGFYNKESGYEREITSLLCSKILRVPSYMGHVNLGLKAIEKGFEVLSNKYFRIRFKSDRKISKSSLKKAIDK